MCVQARRHKEVAERKVEELQLQLQHSHLLSRLKDDKGTAVSETVATLHLHSCDLVLPYQSLSICIITFLENQIMCIQFRASL